MNSDLLQRGKDIKLAIFDVDGVLTDGRLYFLEDGSEFKTFNTLDGQGIKMLMAASPFLKCYVHLWAVLKPLPLQIYFKD